MGFFSRLLGAKKEEGAPKELASEAALEGNSELAPESEVATEPEASAEPESELESKAGAAPELAAEPELETGPEPAPDGPELPDSPELPDAPALLDSPDGPNSPDVAEVVGTPDNVKPASSAASAWQDSFILALRQTEPTPGHWAATLVEGLGAKREADPEAAAGAAGEAGGAESLFWQRLELLLQSLNLPAEQAALFQKDLADWLRSIDYKWPEDISSLDGVNSHGDLKSLEDLRDEVQYRLVLTLGLENEAEEKQRFWSKLWQGLAAARQRLTGGLKELFSSGGELDAAFYESLEEALIASDVGFEASVALVERVRAAAKKQGLKTRAEAKDLLFAEIAAVFNFPPRIQAANRPEVVLMVGVNGAGKTTTIAKLACREHLAGRKVLVVGADTFRAAAIEQLEVWAKRIGADFYAKEQGSDPAAVAYEAMSLALAENYDVVFIDTAGRLQTKTGLMEELGKINRVLGKRHQGAPHRVILVLDATTGQNALSQAKLFSESSQVNEIIISKLDGTAKAGVAVGVAMQFGIPITFIGLGEKMEDLRPFDGEAFAKALLEE